MANKPIEGEKSVISANEDDILRFAEKINQNKQEEQAFKSNLHKLISGDKQLASRPLVIGKTPYALAICGANENLDITIKKSVIDKCLRPEVRDDDGKLIGKTGHGLSEELLSNALLNIKNPVFVLNGSRDGTLVAITDLTDSKNREILVAIELNKRDSFGEVNNITSAYGRENFREYLEWQFESGNVIAANKNKADEMLHSIGKKYPKENTIISFDNSITYSLENVKSLNENFLENFSARPREMAEKLNKPPGTEQRRLTLSERIDKARAENPQQEAPKQDKQQTKKQEQHL